MADEEIKKEVLFSDDGVVRSHKKIHISVFVFLCRVLSAVLVVLGILAFVEGYFGK